MGWLPWSKNRKNRTVDEWVAQGADLAQQGRLQDAAEVFGEGIGHHPNSSALWQNRGAMLGMMKRYAAALECFERASELEPEQIRHWRNRAAMVGLLGRHRDALNAANQGLHLDPNDANLLESRRAALQALGEWEDARPPSKPKTFHSSPEKQGLVSGLIAGTMRRGDIRGLVFLVSQFKEEMQGDLEIIYKVARMNRPDMPTYQEIIQLMAEADEATSENPDLDNSEDAASRAPEDVVIICPGRVRSRPDVSPSVSIECSLLSEYRQTFANSPRLDRLQHPSSVEQWMQKGVRELLDEDPIVALTFFDQGLRTFPDTAGCQKADRFVKLRS